MQTFPPHFWTAHFPSLPSSLPPSQSSVSLPCPSVSTYARVPLPSPMSGNPLKFPLSKLPFLPPLPNFHPTSRPAHIPSPGHPPLPYKWGPPRKVFETLHCCTRVSAHFWNKKFGFCFRASRCGTLWKKIMFATMSYRKEANFIFYMAAEQCRLVLGFSAFSEFRREKCDL